MIPSAQDTEEDYDQKAGRFKDFINAVEESNMGYNFVRSGWNESSLKSKAVAGVFRREQFRTSDGKEAFSTKMSFAISMSTLEKGDFTIPEDRLLSTNRSEPEQFAPIDTSTDDEEVPF